MNAVYFDYSENRLVMEKEGKKLSFPVNPDVIDFLVELKESKDDDFKQAEYILLLYSLKTQERKILKKSRNNLEQPRNLIP